MNTIYIFVGLGFSFHASDFLLSYSVGEVTHPGMAYRGAVLGQGTAAATVIKSLSRTTNDGTKLNHLAASD